MIETLRIQNFKSIKDATVNLKDVNLLIGPNNSGKSNFFAALELLKGWLKSGIVPNDLERFYYKKQLPNFQDYPKGYNQLLTFTITKQLKNKQFFIYKIEFSSGGNHPSISEFQGICDNEIDFCLDDIELIDNYFYQYALIDTSNNFYNNTFFEKNKERLNHNNSISFLEKTTIKGNYLMPFNYIGTNPTKNANFSFNFLEEEIFNFNTEFAPILFQQITSLKTYSIEVNSLKKAYPTLANERQMNEDGSNLVAFLDNMRDENPKIIQRIEKDLKYCIPEFTALRFQKIEVAKESDLYKIHGDKTYKKIGLYDTFGQTYWANELSEGTLYFLALLAIIHQPNPPKLLLLEEPEKGIHPRRISEIMDFIFELAELKNIQVILSTHSTQVVDEFKEMPENIFVFDKPDDATIIRNLQTDILDVDNEKLKAKGIPPIEWLYG